MVKKIFIFILVFICLFFLIKSCFKKQERHNVYYNQAELIYNKNVQNDFIKYDFEHLEVSYQKLLNSCVSSIMPYYKLEYSFSNVEFHEDHISLLVVDNDYRIYNNLNKNINDVYVFCQNNLKGLILDEFIFLLPLKEYSDFINLYRCLNSFHLDGKEVSFCEKVNNKGFAISEFRRVLSSIKFDHIPFFKSNFEIKRREVELKEVKGFEFGSQPSFKYETTKSYKKYYD